MVLIIVVLLYISYFASSVNRTSQQKSLGLFRYNFANLSYAVMLFLKWRRLSPGDSSEQAKLVRCFSACTVMNFNIYHANWSPYSLSCSSGVSGKFSDHCTAWSLVDLAEMSTPGKMSYCLNVFPTWNVSCSQMNDEQELFKKGILTLPWLMGRNNRIFKIIADVHLICPTPCFCILA